ncbi:YcxB family protein [Scardovia wiggsiae]
MNTSFTDDSTYFIVPVDYSYEGFQRRAFNITPRKIGIYRYLFLASLPLIGIFLIVCTNFHLAGWTVLSASLILILIAGLLRVRENKPGNHHIELPNPVYLFLFDSGFIITDDYSSYSSISADRKDSILEKLYLQRIPYSDLCSIKESEKDFYLLIMERGGLTVRKEDCSPGALHFLSSLKDNIPEPTPQPAENDQQVCTQTRHIRGSSQGIAHGGWQEDKPSDIRFIDDTNYFLIPIDTSAKGFYKMRSISIPLWIKILVYTCIPVSLFLAIICTLDKEEHELSPIAWISLLLLCLLPILYRIKTNKIYNSSKILQKKCAMLLFDSGYTMPNVYLAYSDIPAGQHNRELNSLYSHKLPYTTLHGIRESKDYYYLFTAGNSGYIIRKSDCSTNALEFLGNLKTAVGSRKKRKK